MKWIKTKEQLPPENEWVLVKTEDLRKPVDVMQYQGMRIGRMITQKNIFFPNDTCYMEYIYPQWTRGFGHILGAHPQEWASLRETD